MSYGDDTTVMSCSSLVGSRDTRRLGPPAGLKVLLPGIGVLVLVAAAVGRARSSTDGMPSTGGATFLVLLTAAFVCYAVASVVGERRSPSLPIVLVLGAAIQLAPLAGPLLLSSDAHSYAAYGRIDVALGGNPYVDPPAAFPSDRVTAAVAGGWRETPSVYGPVFAAVSAVVARIAGGDPKPAVRLYRVTAAAAMLALIGLAALLAERPARAAAFVGWNPLLAVHFAGGGHNDAIMMVLVLAGLAAGRRRPSAGGACWAAAAAIKWVPLPLYALWAVAASRRGAKTGLSGLVAAAGVIVAFATWRYGLDWTRVVTPLVRTAGEQSRYSLARRLEAVGLPDGVSTVAVVTIAVTGGLFLLRAALSGRARLGLAAGLLLVVTPWLLPWYAVWPVALAATERERNSRVLALVLSAYLLPARIGL